MQMTFEEVAMQVKPSWRKDVEKAKIRPKKGIWALMDQLSRVYRVGMG